MMLQGKLLATGLVLAAAGCTTVGKTSAGLGDAALSPLNDLNVRRTEVPPLLEAIVSPYEPVPAVNCKAIGAMVTELTKILGKDADAPLDPDPTLAESAENGAADLTLGAVKSSASDIIPFRGIVREATGASAHERKLRAAYERGVARRAYLKGVGAQLGCAPPAAPDPTAGMPRQKPPSGAAPARSR